MSARTKLGRHIFVITRTTKQEGYLSPPKQFSRHLQPIIRLPAGHGSPLRR